MRAIWSILLLSNSLPHFSLLSAQPDEKEKNVCWALIILSNAFLLGPDFHTFYQQWLKIWFSEWSVYIKIQNMNPFELEITEYKFMTRKSTQKMCTSMMLLNFGRKYQQGFKYVFIYLCSNGLKWWLIFITEEFNSLMQFRYITYLNQICVSEC